MLSFQAFLSFGDVSNGTFKIKIYSQAYQMVTKKPGWVKTLYKKKRILAMATVELAQVYVLICSIFVLCSEVSKEKVYSSES